jgi:hypothetical protein
MTDHDFVDRPIRLRFRFSEAEADALGDLARAHGISVAALIRVWLSHAINAHRGTPTERKNHANRIGRA